MDIPTVVFRSPYDYLQVKEHMQNKEPFVVVKFDAISVKNLNVMGMMNVVQDYLHLYGYRVKEYGSDNSSQDEDLAVKGYLYERVGD